MSLWGKVTWLRTQSQHVEQLGSNPYIQQGFRAGIWSNHEPPPEDLCEHLGHMYRPLTLPPLYACLHSDFALILSICLGDLQSWPHVFLPVFVQRQGPSEGLLGQMNLTSPSLHPCM